MEPIVYRRRAGAVSRGEREWRVEADALVTRGASGHERRYRWKDIASVQLRCEPAKGRPWRYTFDLQPKHAKRIELDNAHFLGRGAYEDRSASFTPFVRAAVAQLALRNRRARALLGETPKRYFFLLIAALIAFCALAVTLISPTLLDQLPAANLIKLVIVIAILPVFARVVLGAAPRGVALDQIPPRALPPELADISHAVEEAREEEAAALRRSA